MTSLIDELFISGPPRAFFSYPVSAEIEKLLENLLHSSYLAEA